MTNSMIDILSWVKHMQGPKELNNSSNRSPHMDRSLAVDTNISTFVKLHGSCAKDFS